MTAVIQIPNLPVAIALNGSEQYEGVQAGASVRVSTAQIAAFINANYPPPGVSSIATTAPITGGTITTTGTIGLAGAGVTNTYLASMAARTIKGNATGSPAQPSDITVSTALDTIGSTRGSVLYRGSGNWATLGPGYANWVLMSAGSGTDPYWAQQGPYVETIGYQQQLIDFSTRATGGGVDVPSIVSDTGYSHFARNAMGLNDRIHSTYYNALTHGQDDPEGVCLEQPGFASVPLVINGNLASGGSVTLVAATQVSIDPSTDLSYMSFTVNGFNGVTPISEVVPGSTGGRVFTVNDFNVINSVIPSDDTTGDVVVGVREVPGNIEAAYSDNGGLDWPTFSPLVDGLTTGTERGYQSQIFISRTGRIVYLAFVTDIITKVSRTVRWISDDNGVTRTGPFDVTFTGLVAPDPRVIFSTTPWCQRGDGSFVSFGQYGQRVYRMVTTNDAETIACQPILISSRAAPNTLSWQITGINAGTKTVTVAASAGDITAYFPNVMGTTISGSGGANGTSYITGSSFDGTNTLLVLDSLSAGTIGASSLIRQTNGTRQILSVDLPSNTVRLMYDQMAFWPVGSYQTINGTSGGGNRNIDGLWQVVSTTLVPGTPDFVDIELYGGPDRDFPVSLTLTSNARTGSFQLGEVGMDFLTDTNVGLTARINGSPSKIPRWISDDAGESFTYMGETDAPEDSYVSMALKYVESNGQTYELIGGTARGSTGAFFLMSSRVELSQQSSLFFSPLWYWQTFDTTYPNSGYPTMVQMGTDLVIAYGIETAVNLARVECQRVPMGRLLGAPAFYAGPPTADNDITQGFQVGMLWADTSDDSVWIALDVTEGAAVWQNTQSQTAGATLADNIFTGVQQFPSGAVGAPSLAFSAEPTTGIYHRASGAIDFAINGVHRFEWAAGVAKAGSGGVWGFTSGAAPTTAADTGLSRIAAGVIGAGTGAAASVAGQFYGATLRTGQTTVAALPAAATAGKGARAYVTDANATTFLSIVAGGGANEVPVVSNGTNWLIG